MQIPRGILPLGVEVWHVPKKVVRLTWRSASFAGWVVAGVGDGGTAITKGERRVRLRRLDQSIFCINERCGERKGWIMKLENLGSGAHDDGKE